MSTTDIPIQKKCFHIERGYTEQEHTPNGSQCFVMGNNRIIINEHFRNDGRPLENILEKVILNAGNDQKTA